MLTLPALPAQHRIAPFTPFAHFDASFWAQLPEPTQQVLRHFSDQAQHTDWSQLFATDYLRFSIDGNRTAFEVKYFARRHKLLDLTLGYKLQPTEELLQQILDGIGLLCEESGWQLPAHNSYVRDSTIFPYPDVDRPVIDLFAAETAAQLALTRYLLKCALNTAAPMLANRINVEISKRIVAPFVRDHFWWMGDGDDAMCNWTPWCCQNVLIATLLTTSEGGTVRAVIDKVIIALNAFLKDYGEDGACNEGVTYYRHAALCFSNCIDILNTVTHQHYAWVFKVPSVQNMMNFIVHNRISPTQYFNFADSSATQKACDVREFIAGQRVNSLLLPTLAASDHRLTHQSLPYNRLANEAALYYQLQAIENLAAMDECASASNFEDLLTKLQAKYYHSIGQFISRDTRFVVSMKGGNNGDSHNHNDVGSLTLYCDQKPILIDLGVGTYTKKTFSALRYDIWTMQSAWHNLPTINSTMQRDGVEYCAQSPSYLISDNQSAFEIDIAKAYPTSAKVSRWIRRIVHRYNKDITVTEEFEGQGSAVLSFMTINKPHIFENHIQIGACSMAFSTKVNPTIELHSIDDERLRLAWPETIYRLLIQVPPGSHSWSLTC